MDEIGSYSSILRHQNQHFEDFVTIMRYYYAKAKQAL